MKKYKALVKKPVPYRNEAAKQAWHDATLETNPDAFMEMSIVVSGQSVYFRLPKHAVGVIHTRTAGGKWSQVPSSALCRMGGVQNWLNERGAIEADFRGGPKL